MEIIYLDGVREDLSDLPVREKRAMANAPDKLATLGSQVSSPHSSQVKGSTFREVRPRRGRSPWRALYQRIGDRVVVAGIAPEPESDPRGFQRGIAIATHRIEQYSEEQR